MTASTEQLRTVGWLHAVLSARGIDYWLFGGWAVDFHVGRVTRDHEDVDVAVWRSDLSRVTALLETEGWAHAPEAGEDGYTGYERGAVRIEVAFLARDDTSTVYTPLTEGRGEWPPNSFGRTGLGGLMTLPVTLPANVAGNLAINARMVGAIAHLRGYPLSDPHTRTVILLTVTGSNLQSVASEFGVELGKQVARRSIEAIPMAVLNRINARAGFFLVAKYGTKKSAVTLARAIPVAGGLVGGSVDATLTRIIGKAAKKTFTDDHG